MADFDRYGNFKANGQMSIVPFVPINKKSTDKYITFDKRTMRLDKLSYDYYKNSDFGWLIMQANPEYGSIENFIPNGVVLRIPYPLEDTLNTYVNGINSFRELNGYE
jgi:hypothetical protein